MINAHEVTNVDMGQWISDTKLYSADDGTFFVIEADLTDYASMAGPNHFVRRPTVFQFCSGTAVVTNLTPDHVFDPGTTHEQALALAGYQLTG